MIITFIISVCPLVGLSVRLHETTLLMLDRFLLHLIQEYISKISPEEASFIKV